MPLLLLLLQLLLLQSPQESLPMEGRPGAPQPQLPVLRHQTSGGPLEKTKESTNLDNFLPSLPLTDLLKRTPRIPPPLLPPNPHPRQTIQKTRQKSPPELGTQVFHLLLQNKILMEPQHPPPPKEKPKMMPRLPLRRPRSTKDKCTQRATLRSSNHEKKNLSRKVQDVMPFHSINSLLPYEIFFSCFAIPAHY